MTPLPLTFTNIDSQLDTQASCFPRIVSNPGNVTLNDTLAFVKHHQAPLEEALMDAGAIVFRNFPVSTVDEFDDFFIAFEYPPYAEKCLFATPVQASRVKYIYALALSEQSAAGILRSEMACTPLAPSKLFLFCQQPPLEDGTLLLSRSDILFSQFNRIMPEAAEAFIKKGVRYRRIMPPIGTENAPGWHQQLAVDCRSEAEKTLRALGYKWHWLANQHLEIYSPTLPAVMNLANNRQVFFNEVIALFRQAKRQKHEVASIVTYGDGSTIETSALEMLVSVAKNCSFTLHCHPSDIVLLDNYQVMHAWKGFATAGQTKVLAAYAAD